MDKVRCKFICQDVRKAFSRGNDGEKRFVHTARFTPVYSGSEENKRFFSATPSGQLEIGTYLPDCFEPGREYYLDITLAE